MVHHSTPMSFSNLQPIMTWNMLPVLPITHRVTEKVENAIKTAKSLLKKSKAARSDIYLALLEWRNTPSEDLKSSPEQRMFGRRTRTLIPTTSELLKPKMVEDVPGKLFKRKQLQAKYCNISAKELPPLNY